MNKISKQNEIVEGCFQSAYLSFYAFEGYAGYGLMSIRLQLVLNLVFNELKLHRIEANSQPNNIKSISFIRLNGFIQRAISDHAVLCVFHGA